MSADVAMARHGVSDAAALGSHPLGVGAIVRQLDLHRREQSLYAHVAIATGASGDLARVSTRFLDPDEAAYASTLTAPRRQASFLLGRYVAKHAVAASLDEHDLRAVHIAAGVFLQPIVSSPRLPPTQVTISHSDPWAIAIAFPEAHPMGVDVEAVDALRRIDPGSWRTPADARLVAALGVADAQALALLWTVKEALSKALKTGLMTDFDLFELTRIQRIGAAFESTFAHFGQYKAVSWLFDGFVWSIVLPKLTTMRVEELMEAMAHTWTERSSSRAGVSVPR